MCIFTKKKIMQKKKITILQEIITNKICMFSVFFTFILLSLSLDYPNLSRLSNSRVSNEYCKCSKKANLICPMTQECCYPPKTL